MSVAVAAIAADEVATTDLPALTEIERKTLEIIERDAILDRELTPKDDMAEMLGFTGTGTVRGIMLRLERKGYIRIECYQRGRRAYVARLDRWTKQPMCIVPHWRTIYDRSPDTPTLPITTMLEFPTVMAEVNRLMRERNMVFANAQILLMSYGVSMLGFVRAQEGDHA